MAEEYRMHNTKPSASHFLPHESDDEPEVFHIDKHGVKRDSIGWVANPAKQDGNTKDAFRGALPHIEHRHESSPGELFFDLFFVANLMAFTKGHEINDRSTLADYVGFFCILWLSWLQVTMHDVRFPQDSVFERVFKALHLGVMVGFGVVGVYFDPTEGISGERGVAGQSNIHGRAFSRVLMVSRLGLFAQYLLALFLVRKFKRMYLPLVLTSLTYLVSAIIYLGVSYSYQNREAGTTSGSYAFSSWYVIAAAETAVVLVISLCFGGMSFRGSHISERLTLLTLIILGEGVIGLFTSIQSIWKAIDTGVGRHGSIGTFVGLLIAGCLFLYFAYMLYFDNVPAKGLTDARHSIWTALHLPLHVAIVLMVEGNAKALIWVSANNLADVAHRALMQSPLISTVVNATQYERGGLPDLPASMKSASFFSQQADALKAITDAYLSMKLPYPDPTDNSKAVIATSIDAIKNGMDASSQDVLTDAFVVWVTLMKHIFKVFGVDQYHGEDTTDKAKRADDPTAPPDTLASARKSAETINGMSSWWTLVFVYLFVTAGAFLLIIAAMYLVSRKTYHRADYVRAGVCLLAGLAVSLLALLHLSTSDQAFVSSPWMVPVITMLFGLVIVVRHLPLHRVLGERSYHQV